MVATRTSQGAAKEVWVEAVPLDGGGTATIDTQIACTTEELEFVEAFLFLDTIAGAPVAPNPVVSIVNGRLRVVVSNTGAPGNTFTYTLTIERRHSQIR